MAEVTTRQKEIQYSSRTRATSDRFRRLQKVRYALSNLLEKLPDELRDDAGVDLLRIAADDHVYSLDPRHSDYEGLAG
jgi:NTE family protein